MLIDKEFMAAAEYNFTIEQGTTVEKSFVWKDSSGAPFILTGYSARLQIRPSASSDTVYVDATTENGKITVSPNEGRVTLLLSAAETAAFDWKRGKYDLELEAPGGRVTRLLFGVVSVSAEVTRE